MRKLLQGPVGTMLKVLVSVGLMAWLVTRVEWAAFGEQVGKSNPWALALAFLLFSVQFPISAWKWKRCLDVYEIPRTVVEALRINCIGFFLNNFLPSSIGGDGYRVLRTLPEDRPRSRALASVLLERILGFAALVGVGWVGSVLLLFVRPDPLVVWYTIGASAAFVVGGVTLSYLRSPRSEALRGRLARIEKLAVVGQNIAYLRKDPRRVLEVVVVSLLFQVVAAFAIAALYAAVGAPAPLTKCAVIGAISALAAVLPISINGIGVLEGSFVIAAVRLGLDPEASVLVAFLTRFAVVLLSLGCGLVYLAEIRSRGKTAVAEEIRRPEAEKTT